MVRVILNRCDLCGSTDVRRCFVCERWTCGDCVIYVNNTCVHEKYEPIPQSQQTWTPNTELKGMSDGPGD